MDFRINDLVHIQDSLDTRIFEKHARTRQNTRQERILALFVEAGELANETRIFKYWSIQKPSDNQVIFEEYSDVLHFTLSLGIDVDFDKESVSCQGDSKDIMNQLSRLFENIQKFSVTNTYEDYENLLVNVLELGFSLGLNAEDIRSSYLNKNQKNHQRQDDNY